MVWDFCGQNCCQCRSILPACCSSEVLNVVIDFPGWMTCKKLHLEKCARSPGWHDDQNIWFWSLQLIFLLFVLSCFDTNPNVKVLSVHPKTVENSRRSHLLQNSGCTASCCLGSQPHQSTSIVSTNFNAVKIWKMQLSCLKQSAWRHSEVTAADRVKKTDWGKNESEALWQSETSKKNEIKRLNVEAHKEVKIEGVSWWVKSVMISNKFWIHHAPVDGEHDS